MLDQRIETTLQSFCRLLQGATPQNQARYHAVCEARRAMEGRRKHDAAYRASVLRRISAAKIQGDDLSVILYAEANFYTALQAIGRAHRELAYTSELEQSLLYYV